MRVYNRPLFNNEITDIYNLTALNFILPAFADERKLILVDNGFNNDYQFYGFGYNSNQLKYKVPDMAEHAFYGAVDSNSSIKIMKVTSDGFYASLLPGTDKTRKLVLGEGYGNEHQFFGLGATDTTLRYHVQDTTSNSAHVFYAGLSSSNSREIMRIRGDGFIDISGDLNFSGNLYKQNFLFQGAGSSNATYFTTRVGINTSNPQYNLDVNGMINAETGQFSNLTVTQSVNIGSVTGGSLNVQTGNFSNINVVGDGCSI